MKNNDVKVGGFVKIAKVPEEIYKLPSDTVEAFEKSIGKAFKVIGMSDDGHIQIDVGKMPNFNDSKAIWIEPEFVEPIAILTNDFM